jgi:putative membrane protein
MKGRPQFKVDEESPQEAVERVSQVTDILFRAPHFVFSYGLILLLPFLIVPLFWRQLVATPEEGPIYAYRNAFVLFTVPGLLAAAGAWRLARLYGGSFDRRRSAFTALSAEFFLLLIVTVGGLLHHRGGYSFHDPIIVGYAFTVVIHHVALFTTSDHRQIRSAQVGLIQPVGGLVLLHLLFDTTDRAIVLSVVLPLAFLVLTMYFLDLVDAPIRRNTGLSLSEMFRHFLDHLSTGALKAEELMLRIAGEIEALLGVVAVRRPGGELKAAIVVPAVHPGPVGHLGGSNMPAKITQAIGAGDLVMVPHGPATHDFNPASHVEVERIGEASRQLLSSVEYSRMASPLVRVGTDVQVCSQFFGNGALLVYTSWPKPIDDVDFGVGDAAMWSAKYAGASDALFIDAHNSLLLGSGAVFTSDRRAVAIVDTAGASVKESLSQRREGIRAGYAQNKDAFTRLEGIGEQGCQVLVTEVGGKTTAYILWDGNNMLPEVRGRIREHLIGLVNDFEVMTTDNHSVNAIAGGYNPVGYRADVEKIALVTRTTVERALLDLEPVEVGMKTGRIPGLKVFGHWNTIRLVSAVHTIVSLIPRATAVFLLLLVLVTILTLVWVNVYF